MSQSFTRSDETDTYEILTSYNSDTTTLELDIVSSLVKGSHDTSGNSYNNIPGDVRNRWEHARLNPQYVETSAISNYPAGSVTKNSVISLEHVQSEASQKYSVSLNVDASTNPQDFSILPTSTSIYDSNYVFEQSYLPIYYNNGVPSAPSFNPPLDASFSAVFDLSNNHNPSQQAVNTRWNSTLNPTDSSLNGLDTVGPDPVQVSEDASFNQNSALGMAGTSGANYTAKYASSNADGSVLFTDISTNYQPILNNLEVITTTDDTSFNLVDDVGIFKFVQNMDDSVSTTVQLNDGSNNVVTDDLLLKMPLMDASAVTLAAGTSKSALKVPGTMNTNQFNSLFNTAVLNTVADHYNFNIEVTNASGGYYIDTLSDNSGNVMLISDLNNDNILDNPYYMANYVNDIHKIMFSDGSLNLITEPSSNAINAELVTIDLTHGEKLQHDAAGADGKIKINTNSIKSRTDDSDFFGMNASDISVSYTGSNKISDEMMHNPYLHVNYEKVALRSSVEPSANVFLSHNDAFLTLYTDGVVNDKLPKLSTDFSFNKILFANDASDNIRLWRVSANNILASDTEAFFSDYDEEENVGTDLINGICVNSVLTNLTGTLHYDSFRCKLTAKKLEDISLYEAVESASTATSSSNWSISYSNETDLFLKSNSTQAFNNTNSLPKYNSNLITDLANDVVLNYSYEYKTNTNTNTYGGLTDYVEVIYTDARYALTDASYVEHTFIIPDADLTKVYDVSASSIEITEIVDENSYYFTNGTYTKEQWRLVKVVKTSVFSVSFSPNFGVFSNITLTIRDITQTNIYYVLQNKVTEKFSQFSAIQYVSSGSLLANLRQIVETIEPSSGSFKIVGTLTVEDLQPYEGVVEGKGNDISGNDISGNIWVELTDPIHFDTYYAINNIHQLTIDYSNADVEGDITTKCEYNPFFVAQQNLELNNEHYYIPYVYDTNDINYSVESFTCAPSDISTKTNLSSTEVVNSFFTVEDNYDCTNTISTSWISDNDANSVYSIKVSELSNNMTKFTVVKKNEPQTVVFTITRQSNYTFLGTQIVTYIPKDIWRSGKNLGESQSSNEYDEMFASTTYPSNTIGFSNVPGITVDVASNNIYDAGCSVEFRVLGDFITINAGAGDCLDPSSNNELGLSSYNGGNLLFQHGSTDSTNYSAKFTFDRYRGYGEPASPSVQEYVISRADISVTFQVGEDASANRLSQVLTQNMYYNQPLTVSDLSTTNVRCADLNIKFNALYSMPPTGAALLYPVRVVADRVVTTISNLDFSGNAINITVPSGATPVPDPKDYSSTSDLKHYGPNNMYTFSGQSSMTGNLVAFRPSRVKLSNAAFPYNKFKYTIALEIPAMKVYKAETRFVNVYNYIGNPESIGDNTPSLISESDKWKEIRTLSTYSDKLNGIIIGRKRIRQDATKFLKHAVSYFVSTPPYYKYSCVKTVSGSPNPSLYHYTLLTNGQKRTVYLPFDPSINIYNPFAPTIPINDITGTNINIINDPVEVNNIRFTHLKPRSLFDLTINPNANPVGIIVPGINLKITLYSGLHGSTSQSHNIYDGPITSIPFETNVLTHQIVFRNRDASGAVNFSLAQFPSDIGYPDGLDGYKHLFKTDSQSSYYNIDFKLGNVSWFNKNSPTIWFNATADGIKPTLYTVIDVNNPVTKVNSRRVYKYVSTSTYKTDDSLNALQTMNFSFTGERKYYDVVVSQPDLSSVASGIWNYSDLLSNTNVSSSTVSWNTDPSFNETVYISWAFGNSVTSTKMPLDLFYVEEEQRKWVYITLLPFHTMLNQYGLTISETAWDGSFYTPLVTTRVLSLKSQIASPQLGSSNYQMEQYSTSSLN